MTYGKQIGQVFFVASLVILTALLTWRIARDDGTRTVTPIAIAAQADSNVIALQKQFTSLVTKTITRQDSLSAANLQAQFFYWSGVRDAFRSIKDENVRLAK